MYFLSSRSGTANKTSNVGINAQNARYKALRFPKWGVNPFNVETGTNFLVRWSKFAKFLRRALPWGCAIMKVLRKTRKWEERLKLRMAIADSQWSWGFAWATMQIASQHGEAPPDDVAQKWPGRHKVHGQVGHVGTWRTWMDRREGSSHVFMGTTKKCGPCGWGSIA